jgi:hypothetical protein
MARPRDLGGPPLLTIILDSGVTALAARCGMIVVGAEAGVMAIDLKTIKQSV